MMPNLQKYGQEAEHNSTAVKNPEETCPERYLMTNA